MNAAFANKKRMLAAGAAGLAVALAAGWFLVVAPERRQADELAAQVTAAQSELAQKRAELARPSAAVRVKANDLFRLNKALPSEVDTAGVLLDLDRIAKRNELVFWGLTPVQPIVTTAALQQPFDLVLEGRFASISKFLKDVRKLVSIQHRRLAVNGRVYTVDQVRLEEPTGDTKFPNVRATIRVNAFGFTPTSTAPGSTTPTTSTTSTTGTVAAGATP